MRAETEVMKIGNSINWTLCLTFLATILVGCSESALDHASVSGRVTLDGEPLEGAAVTFIPISTTDDGLAGYYSMGETDKDGRYSLRTLEHHSKDGAAVGKHKVIVNKIVESGPEVGELVPPPYNDDRVSPLRFEVPVVGTDAADFDL